LSRPAPFARSNPSLPRLFGAVCFQTLALYRRAPSDPSLVTALSARVSRLPALSSRRNPSLAQLRRPAYLVYPLALSRSAYRRYNTRFRAKPENMEPPQPHPGTIRSRSPRKTVVNKPGEAGRTTWVQNNWIARRTTRSAEVKEEPHEQTRRGRAHDCGSDKWIARRIMRSAEVNRNLSRSGINSFPLQHLNQGCTVEPEQARRLLLVPLGPLESLPYELILKRLDGVAQIQTQVGQAR
jgi:hypothetical protein